MDAKRKMRERVRSGLKAVARETGSAPSSDVLCRRLAELLRSLPKGSCWAGFHAIGHEPDISRVFAEVGDRRWAFPRIENHDLGFYETNDYVSGPHGIREPDPTRSRQVPLGEIDGFLVPGLAFDDKCNRLGRGGGYYDRALQVSGRLKSTALKIGVVFDQQILSETIPLDPHDVAMDWVVSESRTFGRPQSASDPERKASR